MILHVNRSILTFSIQKPILFSAKTSKFDKQQLSTELSGYLLFIFRTGSDDFFCFCLCFFVDILVSRIRVFSDKFLHNPTLNSPSMALIDVC